jgi:hypothetical protein
MFHQYENLNKNGREYKESYLKNFKNTEEKSKIFKKFIEGSQVLENTKINIKNNDNEIVYKLFDKNINNNETMPRSIKGFLEYEGIDFINRKTSPWWKVPDLNVIYP